MNGSSLGALGLIVYVKKIVLFSMGSSKLVRVGPFIPPG